MELEYIVMVIVAVIVMFIGVNILLTIFTGSGVTDLIFNGMNKFVRSIFSGRAYNICEAFDNKELTLEEFQSLLQSMDKEECGVAQVKIRFTVTENDLKRMVSVIGTDKTLLVLSGAARPYGANSILVYGNPGPRPLKRDDKLELRRAGTPNPDIMITLLEAGCDPTDDDCDASCSYKKDVYDPLCCQPNVVTGELCDIDCVDKDNNDVPEKDGMCDPDCYDNDPTINNAYDPDCVKDNDNICDPDSNGVEDGVCDSDCAGDNLICDPDCDGQGGRLYDRECFECDRTCNNFCSRVCEEEDDPDCLQGFGTKTPCCGNGKCELDVGEQCSACPKDCPGAGTTCAGLYTGNIPAGQDALCCPGGDNSDDYGCGIYAINLQEGQACSCNGQCTQGPEKLECSPGVDIEGNYCCPQGEQWDGNECIIPKKFKFVVVAENYDSMDAYRARANKVMKNFIDTSPFSECPKSADVIILDENCPCGQFGCRTQTINCARNALQRDKGQNLDDYDYVVVTLTDDQYCNGYSIGPTPFVICGGGLGELDDFCIAHELGHQFKLCDLYDIGTFNRQNSDFRSWQLLQEFTPYAGCGHEWPFNTGIGPANNCQTDCSINNAACQQATCGVKIGGNAPPYRTSIMGGGGNIGPPVTCPFTNMAGIITAHEPLAYDFIKARLQEAGYCL